VGYVIDRFPRGSHGFVLQEILGLESRGIDVHVFSLGLPEGRPDDTALALARLRRAVSYVLPDAGTDESARDEARRASDGCAPAPRDATSGAARWVASRVVGQRIGHLHAHGAGMATDVVREVGRLTGRGYSFTAHAGDLQGDRASSLREKVQEAQFAVALSDFDRGRLARICGSAAASKLHRIRMGVDLEERGFVEAEDHDTDSILAVGPLVEASGFMDLIDAIRLLRDRGRAARLTILGEGEFAETLQARIERYGLARSVHLVESISRSEFAALMRTCTVIVLPWAPDTGDRDALANLVLDAMAGGLLVLSTDVPDIRELIDDGQSGRVVRPGDPIGLAGALDTFFDSPQLRDSMAWNARTSVEVLFAAQRSVSHLARLFAEAVARKRRAT
jgi:glycosyltransferase involved in cell wall biosynthesis